MQMVVASHVCLTYELFNVPYGFQKQFCGVDSFIWLIPDLCQERKEKKASAMETGWLVSEGNLKCDVSTIQTLIS